MENTKYLIEHRQGGVETIYGYYDNVMEVNEKLSTLGKSEIKDSQDDISVLRLDVHEMEDKYEMPLEEIDTRDVADESKWIKYAFPKTKLEWDLDELCIGGGGMVKKTAPKEVIDFINEKIGLDWTLGQVAEYFYHIMETESTWSNFPYPVKWGRLNFTLFAKLWIDRLKEV